MVVSVRRLRDMKGLAENHADRAAVFRGLFHILEAFGHIINQYDMNILTLEPLQYSNTRSQNE